jgi:hypothetical protein
VAAFLAALMIAIGAWMLLSAARRSEAVPYRWLVARSRLMWAERVHAFHQVSGGLVILSGLLLWGLS